MSLIYIRYLWGRETPEAAAHAQDVLANGFVNLNGNFAYASNPGVISFLDHGTSRVVSISSTNNLTGSTFTVRGSQNGAPIVDIITGPAANNVSYGTEVFDIITSITVDVNSNGVRVGTGNAGYLPLIGVNLQPRTSILNYGLQFEPIDCTCDLYYTLDNVYNNAVSFKDGIANKLFFELETAIDEGAAFAYSAIKNNLLVRVETAVSTATASIIYIQV